MAEEQPTPAEETPAEEQPTPAEETPAEEQPTPAEPTTSQLVTELQQKFTASYNALKEKCEKEIKDRDEIIKQLMTGTPQPEKISVADKINQKRNFKKW